MPALPMIWFGLSDENIGLECDAPRQNGQCDHLKGFSDGADYVIG